ncbi:LANO_0H17436g1_1 [Lachancea nothofagi CBS 11611]|uniref:LANO_0H17436g1_1 n=1 Tax=Lachancea nothofagi CBS 11611 TaxID=1266666 RepID=A0A1G4KN61_9SACH|nr:LANO_0H17436g1_1 [Lachancea nothofagi CBS 11611]
MQIQHLWIALLGLCSVSAQNFYDKNANIMELTPKNFDKVVHRTNYTTLVEFYAPWCGYCQQLKGIMQKAAKNLDGIVQVVGVNCDLAKNKQLCAQHRVEGFPTLMVFRPPKVDLKKHPEDRINLGNHASEVYKGERKLRPIVDFCISRVKNYVTRVPRLEKLATLLNDNSETRLKAVLFSKKDKISPLYKSLALDWLGAIDFHVFLNSKLKGSVSALDSLDGNFKEYLSKLQNTQADSESSLLVIFDPKSQEYYTYDSSSFDKTSVWKFLSQWAEPNEGSFTKRQEYLDDIKSGAKKPQKKKPNAPANQKQNLHDEL